MKSGWKKYLLYTSLIIVGGGLLFGLFQVILAGYSLEWTGFGEYVPTHRDAERRKTLWDWMQLLILPLFLAGGAFYLNRSEREIEREATEKRAELERGIAKDRQQEAALQAYLDKMSELLLENKLRTTAEVEVRDVARTRTISVMRVLDTKRNGLVIQFLRESRLITNETSILKGASMEEMNLKGLNLSNINLSEANLEKADLSQTDLSQSNLSQANLRNANLSNAFMWLTILIEAGLRDANLSNAGLYNANMQEAKLYNANLSGADFSGANLKDATLKGSLVTDEQLEQASSLEGTTMFDGTKHE